VCVALRVSDYPSPATCSEGWVGETRPVYLAVVLLFVSAIRAAALPQATPSFHSLDLEGSGRSVALPAERRMPSRQERRTAERDAAKAAKAEAAVAAAALANLNVSAGGDWTTQQEDALFLRDALGDDVVKRRAG